MRSFATPRHVSTPKTPGWRPGARVEGDYYPTPASAIHALLEIERFDGSIWEPACGTGSITKVLNQRNHFVVSTDLYDRGYGEPFVDFLKETEPRARHIVTNPPYGKGLADRFVERALTLTALTGGKVAMLLNLASLCHPMRTEWWHRHSPARIYAVDECVCWDAHLFGPPPWHTNTHRYFWAVWEHGHKGPSQFTWISASKNMRI